MKKFVLVMLVSSIIVLNATPGYCETPAFRKFRRGFCNLVTFHLEFMNQVERAGAKGGNGRAKTFGVFNGITMPAARILTGAYEVVTFPIPFPSGYKPIMNDPEFY